MVEGVVVLYYPSEEVIKNINSYLPFLEKLYVIDNSPSLKWSLIEKLKRLGEKIVYISNRENKGIGYALNRGAELAIKDGAKWLLTMDQDSRFKEGDLGRLIEIAHQESEKTAIVSPVHDEGEKKSGKFVLTTMTSGNLLRLDSYRKVGPFREEFFMDMIDAEYCLRVNRAGYKVRIVKEILLHHELGNTKQYKLLGFRFFSTNHSPLRRYYTTRNRLAVWKEYGKEFPKFLQEDRKNAIKEIIKILLVEREKMAKLKAIFKGVRDYRRGRFGPLPEGEL